MEFVVLCVARAVRLYVPSVDIKKIMSKQKNIVFKPNETKHMQPRGTDVPQYMHDLTPYSYPTTK